uniref:polynucleotide adenylyltransferase n=1 Tax=Meloidogyne incognita TaxID=6306 RepID=A0A914KHJ8_MELIC
MPRPSARIEKSKPLPYNEAHLNREFQLLEGGSEILGTTAYWSDMDILCILPKYINIYDFIEEDASGLYGSLMAIMRSDNINIVKTSRILMLELKMNGIDVDLIYAQIPFEKIETDFDIMDDEIIEGNKNARSILALAGVRCLKIIRQDYICQNQKLLVLLMRYVKIWAKNRLIYSNIAGYLSGHSLSIMSAKICIENPEATSLSFVIKQFFNVYKAWNWGEEPLFLVDLVDTNEEFGNASEIVEPWRWVKNENFDSSRFEDYKKLIIKLYIKWFHVGGYNIYFLNIEPYSGPSCRSLNTPIYWSTQRSKPMQAYMV